MNQLKLLAACLTWGTGASILLHTIIEPRSLIVDCFVLAYVFLSTFVGVAIIGEIKCK